MTRINVSDFKMQPCSDNPNPRIAFPTTMTAKSYDRLPILWFPTSFHTRPAWIFWVRRFRGVLHRPFYFNALLTVHTRVMSCPIDSCERPGTANLQACLIIVKYSYSDSHIFCAAIIYRAKCST